MKRLLTAALLTTALATPALAADDDLDVLPPNYTSFVNISLLYSFGILDRDFDLANATTRVEGSLDPSYSLGGTIEVGAFLSERVRVSTDLRYYTTDFDSVTLGGQTGSIVDANVDNVQAFVNIAYEFPLADIITLPLLERSKIFGIAGIGAAYVDLGGDDDTQFAAKVGLGTVTDLTETVALVSETDYIFGSDFEFESGGVTGELENSEIVSTIGLRFRF